MRWTVGLLSALLLARTAAPGQARVVRTDFCEVLNNAKQYDGKEITVRGTYLYWFETSELFCLTCRDKGKVWLEFVDLDEKSEAALRSGPGAGEINLTITGTFRTGSTYGHLNGYRHEFVARRVWDVATVFKGIGKIDKEKAAEAKWACGGTNPR